MSNAHVFRDIRDKNTPADILYEDDDVLIFPDIHPQAPTHLLLIPKEEVASILAIDEDSAHIPGMLIAKAKSFAETHSLPGYKLVFHCGKEGGQIIERGQHQALLDKQGSYARMWELQLQEEN